MSADEVEEIFARLRAGTAADAHATLATLQKVSPTSLKITLRNVHSALSFDKLEQSFQQDYRLSLACISGARFHRRHSRGHRRQGSQADLASGQT